MTHVMFSIFVYISKVVHFFPGSGLIFDPLLIILYSQIRTLSILSFPIGLNLVGGGGAVISNTLLLLANKSTLGCLKEVMKTGLSAIPAGIRDIDIRNLWNPRSRVNVVLLSKRKHLVYFLIPPVYTSGKLLFSYCCQKKGSLNLGTLRFPKNFPKFPKNGQAQA